MGGAGRAQGNATTSILPSLVTHGRQKSSPPFSRRQDLNLFPKSSQHMPLPGPGHQTKSSQALDCPAIALPPLVGKAKPHTLPAHQCSGTVPMLVFQRTLATWFRKKRNVPPNHSVHIKNFSPRENGHSVPSVLVKNLPSLSRPTFTMIHTPNPSLLTLTLRP